MQGLWHRAWGMEHRAELRTEKLSGVASHLACPLSPVLRRGRRAQAWQAGYSDFCFLTFLEPIIRFPRLLCGQRPPQSKMTSS